MRRWVTSLMGLALLSVGSCFLVIRPDPDLFEEKQSNGNCNDGIDNDEDGLADEGDNDCGFCGDGVVTPPEECDDANRLDRDGCQQDCTSARCGDGIIDQVPTVDRDGDGINDPEECDDANQTNGDGCSSVCALEIFNFCGDGIVSGAEQCDDGNDKNDDGCDAACRLELCGDGVVQPSLGEECDDGGDTNGDGCSAFCKVEFCGDGVVQDSLGEECDPGADIIINCADCLIVIPAFCGDNTVQGGEECDDGNNISGDGCDQNCTNTACGNLIKSGPEECDDGNVDDGDGCASDCTLEPSCGDGITQAATGEECDDGNNNNNDACLNSCKNALCGDSVVQIGVEQCDDGNAKDDDACLTSCLFASCGDGFLRTNFEQCDDGNVDDGDGCSALCEIESGCSHDVCQSGAPLDASCGECEAAICDSDPFCCEVGWDDSCRAQVSAICALPACPAS